MDRTQEICDIYRQKLLIHEVAAETGMPWHDVYRHLKNAGVLNIETRLVSGSTTDRMGAFYEKEFSLLVSDAKCQNDITKQFEYDFLVGSAKVEVKSSSRHNYKNRSYWKFQVYTRSTRRRHADFYVCFGSLDQADLKKYKIFCFPSELLRGGSVNVNTSLSGEWAKFIISPDELTKMFSLIAKC